MRPSADRIPLALRRWIIGVLPEAQWQTLRPLVLGETGPQQDLKRLRVARACARARRMKGSVQAVHYRGAIRYGHVVSHFDAEKVKHETLTRIGDVLTQGDIAWTLLDQEPAKASKVVVPRIERTQAARALRASLRDEAFYVRPRIRGRWRSAKLVEHWSQETLASADSLRAFRILVSSGNAVLSTDELACEIEFWNSLKNDGPPAPGADPLPSGTLLAPSRNRWAAHLKPSDWASRQQNGANLTTLGLEETQNPHVYDPVEPIDVVYTWVDDTDEAWQHKKAQALTRADPDAHHATAISDSRYKSHDELRYSLRSLEMYANWFRNVYIVTDDQVPEWLDTSHPRLKLVSHRSLFGNRGKLPTFNSHAIEAQLHHIDGLSENFLYLNDDVFFGRHVAPSQFFHSNGIAQFFPSNAKLDFGDVRASDAPVMSAAKNNRKLILRKFGRTFTNKMKHVPHALRRSVLAEMELEFPEEHDATSRSQFRGPGDCSFVSSLHHWYAYCTGRAVPGDIRYFYADIGRHESPARLEHLLRRQNVDVFCLNDHDVTGLGPAERARALEKFLSRYFPLASSFEMARTE